MIRTRQVADRQVAVVGVGDASFARAAARGRDVSEVVRRIHEAIEHNLDLIDVANEPDVERAVGEATRTLRARDRVVVATRIAVLAERAGAPTRDLLPERLPAKYVQEQVEASLRASRLDVMPLVQLPLRATWRGSSAWPELRGTCARLVGEGKVMHWGAIGDEAELASEDWLATIAIDFSVCTRAAVAVLTAAAKAKIAVLARKPFAGGALTGMLGPGVKLAPADDRRALSESELETIAVGAAKLTHLVKREPPAARSCAPARAVLERGRKAEHVECTTLAELALRYVIDRGTIALPRLHRREDLAEAISAADSAPLPPHVIATIDELWPDPTT